MQLLVVCYLSFFSEEETGSFIFTLSFYKKSLDLEKLERQQRIMGSVQILLLFNFTRRILELCPLNPIENPWLRKVHLRRVLCHIWH